MMPGTFRIRKWLEPPVGLADSPCGSCRHCFAMPGVLSAFPYSRFARIPGPDARLMTQSLRSEGGGIHPDNYGYTLWAKSIEKPVLKILKKYGIRK